MPTIREEISGRDGLARRRIKAQRLAENAAARLPITWTMGTGQNRVTTAVTAASHDGEALRLDVQASRGAWSKADDLRIINPPIMVPTGRQVPNPEGGMMNEYREDPVEAIRQVIEDVVRLWRQGAQ